MEEVLDPPLADFIAAQLPERPPQILALEREALEKNFPIIGPACGRVLETMARAVSATRVLELGSGFGYSAYWFSRAMRDGSEIICTDGEAHNAERAKALHQALFPHVAMSFYVGEALQEVKKLVVSEPFDVVFVDIDKHAYPQALSLARSVVKVGGAIIFDNVLWHRKVLSEQANDAATQGVRELHRQLREASDLRTFIVPIRDGLSVSIREQK